jgi:hypothetical protein
MQTAKLGGTQHREGPEAKSVGGRTRVEASHATRIRNEDGKTAVIVVANIVQVVATHPGNEHPLLEGMGRRGENQERKHWPGRDRVDTDELILLIADMSVVMGLFFEWAF